MPTVKELKEKAKSMGLRGYSKLTKSELLKLTSGSRKPVSKKSASRKSVSKKPASRKSVGSQKHPNLYNTVLKILRKNFGGRRSILPELATDISDGLYKNLSSKKYPTEAGDIYYALMAPMCNLETENDDSLYSEDGKKLVLSVLDSYRKDGGVVQEAMIRDLRESLGIKYV